MHMCDPRSTKPLDLQVLSCPTDIWFVIVTPVFEAPTKKMRAALPKEISMQSHIENTGAAGPTVFATLGFGF